MPSSSQSASQTQGRSKCPDPSADAGGANARREAQLFLNNDDAARFLNLSPCTLEKHRVIGDGPRFRKFGRRIVYAMADLEAWAGRAGLREHLRSAIRRQATTNRALFRDHQTRGEEINSMILAFVSQRGGVGKTTLALHVAGELARRGERVTVIDADPQESALGWAVARAWNERARQFAVVGLAHETLPGEVPDIARANDYVIIDGPPRTPALTHAVLVAADRAVIPVQPGPFDVWTCHEIVELVKKVQVFKPRLTAAFVLNRVIPGTVIARAMAKPLSRNEIGRLAIEIRQRVIFAESLGRGLLASEIERHGGAAEDIRRLVDAIRRLRP